VDVLVGCDVAVDVPAPANNDGAAVAVDAAGCAAELAPPSEKPANGVEVVAPDVAVAAGCEVPALLCPPIPEKSGGVDVPAAPPEPCCCPPSPLNSGVDVPGAVPDPVCWPPRF
jgi:hypothetical protein